MYSRTDVTDLSTYFQKCQKLLLALGAENRQHIILKMLQMGNCSGVRIGDITRETNLSRAAVSYHLRILKESGILKVRKEGTKNYYYFSYDLEPLKKLIAFLQTATELAAQLPNRKEKRMPKTENK